MTKIIWFMAVAVWILFVATIIKDHFQTKADKREVQRRDREYLMRGRK